MARGPDLHLSASPTFRSPETDPILFLGLDIATKRDTSALLAISPGEDFHTYYVWGYRIWEPPVNLVLDVEPMVLHLFLNYSIAGLWYDEFQALTLVQRLRVAGHGHRLVEVNQGTQMTQAANTLQSLLTEDRLILPGGDSGKELRGYFSWTAAKKTERGFRIVKTSQTKKIDPVVAMAMAVLGATHEYGHGTYPTWSNRVHVRSPFVFDGVGGVAA